MGTVIALLAAVLMADRPADPPPGDDTEPAPIVQPAPETHAIERVSYVIEFDRTDEPTERWTGMVDLGGTSLGFTVVLTKNEPAGLADPAWSGLIDIPMQGVEGLPVSRIVRTDTELSFVAELPGLPEANWPRWTLTIADDGTAQGVLRQNGMESPTSMRQVGDDDPAEQLRLQEPRPPFPYRTKEITIETEAGHALAGTLVLPDEAAFRPPYPTAVLITGSGPQDRDSTILGHKPFLVLADHLARRGIASLRCDDRGVGRSTGRFGEATTLDFADDAASQVRTLAEMDEIGSIGLIGHSEGGVAAPIAAVGSERVDWLVLLGAPGVPGREIIPRQLGELLRAEGVTDEDAIAELVRAQRDVLASVLRGDDEATRELLLAVLRRQAEMNGQAIPDAELSQQAETQLVAITSDWYVGYLKLDPRAALRRFTGPVLVLNGARDTQVLADQNVPEIEAALSEAGNTEVETRVLEGLNHLFQPAETGSPSEYASIEITFDPGALEIISGWIRRR